MKPVAPALLAATALSLVACGGSAGSPSPPGPGTVLLREYEFAPTRPAVRSGATLTVRNDGQVAHNLKLEDRRSHVLVGTDDLIAGQKAALRVNLPPGRYRIVCTVPGHQKLGMVGSVTVKQRR